MKYVKVIIMRLRDMRLRHDMLCYGAVFQSINQEFMKYLKSTFHDQ